MAAKLGYQKVSELKRDVALKIRDYVIGGGFMFAMCSATDTFDIAFIPACNFNIAIFIFNLKLTIGRHCQCFFNGFTVFILSFNKLINRNYTD